MTYMRASTGQSMRMFSERYSQDNIKQAHAKAQAFYSMGYNAEIKEVNGMYEVSPKDKTDFYKNLDETISKSSQYNPEKIEEMFR